jgi:hypothetical protein
MKSFLLLLCMLPLARAEEWKQLFNGKDFTGWEHVGPGRFTLENGMLKTEGGMGLLEYTGGKIENTAYPANFCPLFWRVEFAGFRKYLGEPIGESVEAMS